MVVVARQAAKAAVVGAALLVTVLVGLGVILLLRIQMALGQCKGIAAGRGTTFLLVVGLMEVVVAAVVVLVVMAIIMVVMVALVGLVRRLHLQTHH